LKFVDTRATSILSMEENSMKNEWRGDWHKFTDPVIAADGYTYEKKRHGGVAENA
jgi:hypothetical protein